MLTWTGYLKKSVDQIVNFFESNAAVSQKLSLETAATMQCPRQSGSTECGYFTLKFMKELVKHGVRPLENDTIGGDSNEYTDADINDIREEWAIYVSNFIIR